MATDTAPAVGITPHHYWQLPTFLLGVACVCLSLKFFPVQPGTASGHEIERERYALRLALERKPIKLADVQEAVEKLGAATGPGATESASFYLLGSAQVWLAEQDTIDAAMDHWQAARTYLSQCNKADLADVQDQTRLAFRLAKANAATQQGDATATVAALDIVPKGEDPGERQRLLAEACLRQPPPDIRRAKTELSAYLSGPPTGSLAQNTRLRLKLADLCVQSGEGDRAQAWLREVSEKSPPALQAQAKMQLAQLLLADRNINDAVKLFEATEQLPGITPEQRSQIRYLTGNGLVGLGNLKAAGTYLKKAQETPGPAATAAHVRIAEVEAKANNAEAAMDAIAPVLGETKSAEAWNNPYIGLPELRTTAEATIQALRSQKMFDAAMTLSRSYAAIAENHTELQLVAETLLQWAEMPRVGDRRGKLTQAGSEFVKLAGFRKPEAEQAKCLEQAHGAFMAAGDISQADEVLQKLAALPGLKRDQLAALQLKKAQTLLQEQKYAEAATLLKDISNTPGGVGLRASVKWAFAEVKAGMAMLNDNSREAQGREKIREGLRVITEVANKGYDVVDERFAHEESLYYLGRFLIEPILADTLNATDAESRFRRLIREYPRGEHVENAKLFLAFTLCSQAKAKSAGNATPANATAMLREARDLFAGLGNSTDEFTRVHADIRLLFCHLLLKEFDALIDQSKKLAEKYRGTVMELVVLNIQYAGYKQTNRPDLATAVKEQIRGLYEQLPDSAYRTDMEEFTKARWEKLFGPKAK